MKLKPCPFCGSENINIENRNIANGLVFWVECDNCGGSGACCSKAEYAIDEWNTRHYPTCEKCKWFLCGEGGYGLCQNPISPMKKTQDRTGFAYDDFGADFGCIHHEPKEE